jgi:hypothetical protein
MSCRRAATRKYLPIWTRLGDSKWRKCGIFRLACRLLAKGQDRPLSGKPDMSAVSSIASTVVSADRLPPVTDVGANAIYSRGGEFAQALAKVDQDPSTINALQQAGELATTAPTSGLATLAQASSQASNVPQQASGTISQLQQLLQAGGAQLNATSRVALDFKL